MPGKVSWLDAARAEPQIEQFEQAKLIVIDEHHINAVKSKVSELTAIAPSAKRPPSDICTLRAELAAGVYAAQGDDDRASIQRRAVAGL